MKKLVLLLLNSTVLAGCMLPVTWDRVYGEGFFVANILGNPVFARAVLAGTKGTILNVEFYAPTPGQMTNVKGVAVDNDGNIFKLTF
jgi:hypothetical protein